MESSLALKTTLDAPPAFSSVGSIGAAPAITTTSSDVDSALDTIEDAVSPGLRLKYTNR